MKRFIRSALRNPVVNALATNATRLLLPSRYRDTARRHLLRLGRVTARLPNGLTLVLLSPNGDPLSNAIFWGGWDGYERASSRVWWRLALQADVVLDVGAYIGYHSLLAAHANPKARVYSFEPLPSAYALLEQNLAANRANHAMAIHSAVGECVGKGILYYNETPNRIPMNSSLYARLEGRPDLQRQEVPVTTLDTFAGENGLGQVDLLKVDAENLEAQVLRGGIGLLTRCRPRIVCEILSGHGHETSLEALLAPLGYRYWHLTDEGITEHASLAGRNDRQRNYLFSVTRPL